MSSELEDAKRFLFEETYQMWKSDLTKIFRIGTRSAKGGCNLSACILVLIGIESFSKFFSNNKTDVGAFADFVDKYYPDQYRGKMKKIYELFRHGLAHNYFPKSEFNLIHAATIAFGLNERKQVVTLSHLKKDLENCRMRVLKLSPQEGKPYVLVPQVLFLDTVNVMEKLKREVEFNSQLQYDLISNSIKIRKVLRHSIKQM